MNPIKTAIIIIQAFTILFQIIAISFMIYNYKQLRGYEKKCKNYFVGDNDDKTR